VDAALFWDMTYAEIVASINGFNNRQKSELQLNALISYRQAGLISALVGIAFGSKQQYPTITDAFPGIFPELEKAPQQQQNWQVMKARVEEYAAAKRDEAKRKRGENDGNNAGGAAGPNNV
jgi:hypothetical protein